MIIDIEKPALFPTPPKKCNHVRYQRSQSEDVTCSETVNTAQQFQVVEAV